ncbi:hypothetical protein M8J76_007880 [Diaphorina citri]|nr:hypothetical protein M8J75_009762 [Diaphorina citri]KAI5729914.1 hypothetical protein M8J76_007880 [Diaphorina citri]KAI5735755.1 hypothetical protein M8J77_022201 [Diaphorina citri]
MLPIILRVLRSYAPAITVPFAGIIGFIGYQLESRYRNTYTPSIESVIDTQTLRDADESVTSLSDKKIQPDTIFDKNLPPSLS